MFAHNTLYTLHFDFPFDLHFRKKKAIAIAMKHAPHILKLVTLQMTEKLISFLCVFFFQVKNKKTTNAKDEKNAF